MLSCRSFSLTKIVVNKDYSNEPIEIMGNLMLISALCKYRFRILRYKIYEKRRKFWKKSNDSLKN